MFYNLVFGTDVVTIGHCSTISQETHLRSFRRHNVIKNPCGLPTDRILSAGCAAFASKLFRLTCCGGERTATCRQFRKLARAIKYSGPMVFLMTPGVCIGSGSCSRSFAQIYAHASKHVAGV